MRFLSGFILATAAALPHLASAQAVSPAVAAPSSADSTVLLRGPAGAVTLGQVRAGVEAIVPPAQRDGFFAYSRNIEQMARTIYVYMALNSQAKLQGFDRQPDVEKVLEISLKRALADLWIVRESNKHAPNPEQLEKYARSVFEASSPNNVDGKPVNFEAQRPELIEQARAKLLNDIRMDLWKSAEGGAEPDAAAIAAQVRPELAK